MTPDFSTNLAYPIDNELKIKKSSNTENIDQFLIKDLRPKIVLKFPNNTKPSPRLL